MTNYSTFVFYHLTFGHCAAVFQIPPLQQSLCVGCNAATLYNHTYSDTLLFVYFFMDNSQLKKMTASFSDIEPLFAKKKKLLQEARQTRRRLKTKLNEYSFLKTLVGINVKDRELEIAIKECFDAFGFDKVECVGEIFKEEEVYGGFIANHNSVKPFDQRHKRPFDEKVNILAKGSEITLLTTVDILNSFINFKKGKLTLDDFVRQLCTPGIFKILET